MARALGCAWVEGVARPRVGGTGHTQRLQPDRMNGTAPNGTNAQRRDATPTEVGTEPRGARPGAPRGSAPGPGRPEYIIYLKLNSQYRASAIENAGGKFVGSRNTRSAGRRRVYTGEKCSFCAKVALRTLCLRALPYCARL